MELRRKSGAAAGYPGETTVGAGAGNAFLCRSLTLSADRLLMGPVSWEPCPGLIRMDHEGVRIPADKEDAAAFLAFLSAAGYGNYPAATDDLRILSPNEQEIACWQGTKMPEEERKKCLSLN